MADLARLFAARAAEFGERPALITAEGAVSFATLQARANAFAATCQARGITRGDRMLLAMPIGADLFAALAGAWQVGATVVFPEPAMGLKGLRHAVATTQPKALIATGLYRLLRLLPGLWRCPTLAPRGSRATPIAAPGPEPEDIALISFTSGSTGAPKAIARSQAFLMAQHDAVAPLLDGDGAIDLVAFPVFTLVNLAAGRCSVLPNWRAAKAGDVTPEALAELLTRTAATRALLPPALCETLTHAPRPAALTTIFTGGGPVKPDLVDRLQAQGLRVVSAYGSTEAEPIAELDWADVTAEDQAAMRAGAGLLAGPPVAGLELRLRDDEIQVAGDHVNDGYLDPAQNADTKVQEDGRVWHRTGDAGRLDPEGRLWLLGRHNAIVETDGGRLYPFAVELAAESMPGIRHAALSQVGGEAILAVEAESAERAQEVAQTLGLSRAVVLPQLPRDRRHRSKIDTVALNEAVARALR